MGYQKMFFYLISLFGRSVRLSQKTLCFTKDLKFKAVETRLFSEMVERESSNLTAPNYFQKHRYHASSFPLQNDANISGP